ncbi:DENN domain-containing protein 2A-like isoform X2 [Lineus longissimus]|uniref:DENN domain-containing protein 2A-like isoform X2 n=1 Tax=Lineus longissimus TaxID=88925 RepID=UPI00315DF966
MDEELRKVDLGALRRKFETESHVGRVDKRQSAIEVSKSQFELTSKAGAGNSDGVRRRVAKPPMTQRRSSEPDMIDKPVISPKPLWVSKKPMGGEVQAGTPVNFGSNVAVKPQLQLRSKGVIEKHAKLFGQSGLSVVPSPSESDSSVSKALRSILPSHPVLAKVVPSVAENDHEASVDKEPRRTSENDTSVKNALLKVAMSHPVLTKVQPSGGLDAKDKPVRPSGGLDVKGKPVRPSGGLDVKDKTVGPSGGRDAKDKPTPTPRRQLNIVTSPESKTKQEDNEISVQSKKKLFENPDNKVDINLGPKSEETDKQSFNAVLRKMQAAKIGDQSRGIKMELGLSNGVKTDSNIETKRVPPQKPNRTFAHDIYQEGKMQRQSALSTMDQTGERPEEEVFGMVDFRTRGVIVGEEDGFISQDRPDRGADIGDVTLGSDSSFHDYEDVNLRTSITQPLPPGCRPALPIPTKRNIGTPKKYLFADDYNTMERFQVRSWGAGNSSTKSNKSDFSQRSNSDECLYSHTYEIAAPAEYVDPTDLFARPPQGKIPGFPDVEIDEYGYALPQHSKLKTPLFMSRSLDGAFRWLLCSHGTGARHTKFQPPTQRPPGIPKDSKDVVKRPKVITAKKKSPKAEERDSFPTYVKKDDLTSKASLDYVKTYRRKPAIRQKIGQAFSILRRNVTDDVDGDYEPSVDNREDDRQSNDSESEIDIQDLQRRIQHVTSIKEKNQSIYERVRAFRERIYPQLFDYAVIVGLEMVNGNCQPVVLHKFPHHVDPEKTSIPEFCFPDKDVLIPVTKYDSENFSFVLTSCDGRRDYGYCKRMLPPGRGARLPEVICIVSPLGAHTLYTQVLDHAEKRRNVSNDYVMELIAATYGKPLPCLGRSIDVNSMNTQGTLETLTLSRQEDTRMENVNFEYLFSCLGIENVLQVFSAILLERRTLFSASKLSTLSNCIHALAGLLYPFQWQHTFIPVLPAALLDITCAPTPYIIGIMSPYLPQIDDLPTEEVLIIDLDKACLLRTCDDETTILPRKLQKALIGALTMAMEDSDGQKNVLISEAFVRLFVESIGHFEEHIGVQQDGKKVFQKDSFCKAVSSKSLRMFLEWFCETQMFHIFVDDHLDGQQREKGLFDARISEYKQELASMPPTTWNNFREKLRNIGKAIKTNIKSAGDQKKKAT